MDRIQYLSQFNLMSSLSREDLIVMDEITSITTYPKQMFIQTPDTFEEKLYFIKKGKVRLYRLSAGGKQFTLDLLSEGNIFGEMGGISLGTRELYIETVEASEICVMNKDRFESYLIQRPRFMMNMIKVMGERLSHMSSLAQSLALGNLHDKILHVLVELAVKFGVQPGGDDYGVLRVSLSHEELAHMVGASRAAVTAGLRELVEEGAIRTGFRTVSIRLNKLAAANNPLDTPKL